MQEQAIAGGAERVLYVLATLAREEAPLTVAALAERTGLAQSTLYRQVALLKRWGFVLEQAGAYTPGPLCVQLARGFDQSSYLIQEALPDMTRLAADSGETVGLLVAMSDQAVCLEMVESGASAKSLMAFMAPARLQGRLHELAGQGVDA
ncbi:helix-turn-helix domain-containing protein, partial [Bordetella pertussis]|uniref:helix-turn-helix domain-containing protein n=1 Tax=Bordetella pertussis TaxID=520 RepID=UPI000A426EE6